MGGADPSPSGTTPEQEPRLPAKKPKGSGAGRQEQAPEAAPASAEDGPLEEPISTWPLDVEHLDLAAEWLADERNAQWLDFGAGVRTLTPMMLKMMIQRDQNCIWVFGPAGERTPAGLVGLGHIQSVFRTGEIWYLLGDKAQARRGLTFQAVCRLLEHGFGELGLHCIYGWTVESNVPSRRILEKAGFRHAGRIRDRHRIGEEAQDRLWFDLLAHEYERVRA